MVDPERLREVHLVEQLGHLQRVGVLRAALRQRGEEAVTGMDWAVVGLRTSSLRPSIYTYPRRSTYLALCRMSDDSESPAPSPLDQNRPI